MTTGRIININSSKYLVEVNQKIIDCTLRGIFRKDKITPLVGDEVEVNLEDKQIVKIFDRKNYLQRPSIANIDYAVILTSTKKPDLDLNLLDKLLVNIIARDIKPIIVFSKTDLLNDQELKDFTKIKDYYENIGIKAFINDQIIEFEKYISKKVVVLCGQTGAGKSTFINRIDSRLNLDTKEISDALGRGVHTTRYVSLYQIKDYYIADTPGFSALSLTDFEEEQIRHAFIEFNNYDCQYRDCNHIHTSGCKILENIGKGIMPSRYENYTKFIKEYHESSRKLFKK